jgi:hypothetical protein
MQKTYDKAIIGKHVHSPPKSPDNHKLARCEEDCKVSADVGDKPKLVVVPMKAAESVAKSEASLPLLQDNASFSRAVICPETVHHRKMHDAVVPFVTPATFDPGHTIVSQHHLNNIQRNIFVQPNTTYPNVYQQEYYRQDQVQSVRSSTSETNLNVKDELQTKEKENKELKDRIRVLEEQLVQSKEKYHDNIAIYKEKYEEARHNLREARQYAKFADMHAATIANWTSRIIQ